MTHENPDAGGSWFDSIKNYFSSESSEGNTFSARNAALDSIEDLAHTANTHFDIEVRRDAVDKINEIQSTGVLRTADLNPRVLNRMGYGHLTEMVRDAEEGKHAPEGAPTRDWVNGTKGIQGPYNPKKRS